MGIYVIITGAAVCSLLLRSLCFPCPTAAYSSSIGHLVCAAAPPSAAQRPAPSAQPSPSGRARPAHLLAEALELAVAHAVLKFEVDHQALPRPRQRGLLLGAPRGVVGAARCDERGAALPPGRQLLGAHRLGALLALQRRAGRGGAGRKEASATQPSPLATPSQKLGLARRKSTTAAPGAAPRRASAPPPPSWRPWPSPS